MGVAGDKLKKSQISAEALYLTADPAMAEKLVPIEVETERFQELFLYDHKTLDVGG